MSRCGTDIIYTLKFGYFERCAPYDAMILWRDEGKPCGMPPTVRNKINVSASDRWSPAISNNNVIYTCRACLYRTNTGALHQLMKSRRSVHAKSYNRIVMSSAVFRTPLGLPRRTDPVVTSVACGETGVRERMLNERCVLRLCKVRRRCWPKAGTRPTIRYDTRC